MSGPTESPNTSTVLARLAQGARGRLVARDGDVEIAVYVDKGSVIAADASDDPAALVRRLLADGLIEEATAARLRDWTEGLGSVLDAVGDAKVDAQLHERFLDNLSRFLVFAGPPAWEPLEATFANNVQLMRDPQAIVQMCDMTGRAAALVSPEWRIRPGPTHPANAFQAGVLSFVHGEVLVADVVRQMSEEPIAVRAGMADMIEAGVIAVVGGPGFVGRPPGLTPPGPPVAAPRPPPDAFAAPPSSLGPRIDMPTSPDAGERIGAVPSMPFVDFHGEGSVKPPPPSRPPPVRSAPSVEVEREPWAGPSPLLLLVGGLVVGVGAMVGVGWWLGLI